MNIHGQTAAEIFESVRMLVLTRQLHAGMALPPVRELANTLGVNRNTVATAYRRLATAGVATTQRRRGTIIRALPSAGEQEGARAGTALIDLADGNPNAAWLPDPGAVWQGRPCPARLYGAPLINPALARYITQWCAPDCPPGLKVDLSHGAVDAIERLLAAYLRPGDKVAVEDPCFLNSINLLRNAGLQALGVPVDAQGMSAEALQNACRSGAQAVILTPRAHNPTGCSLTAQRAKALMRVLEQHPHVLIIIDDHFALLSGQPYHGVIPPNARRWSLVRSFSKALGPDVRVAALASDAATSQQLRARMGPGSQWVSHFLQDTVELLLQRAETARQVRQAGSDYLQRRRRLEQALLSEGLHPWLGGDGLNLWLPVTGDDRQVALSMAQQGWLLRHGEVFSVQKKTPGLRITLSTLDGPAMRRLARDLRVSLGPDGTATLVAPA
jgi:DNA-binding transcriptional MocR family regulator